MLREEEEEESGGGGEGKEYKEQREGGGTELLYPQVGRPHVGRALRVKTIDFKRLYMNNNVQQNKNFYEEQLLQ